MITSKLPKDLDLSHTGTVTVQLEGTLCVHIRSCFKTNCNNCLGTAPMKELRAIEPELTNENILKVIQLYEVLLK